MLRTQHNKGMVFEMAMMRADQEDIKQTYLNNCDLIRLVVHRLSCKTRIERAYA